MATDPMTTDKDKDGGAAFPFADDEIAAIWTRHELADNGDMEGEDWDTYVAFEDAHTDRATLLAQHDRDQYAIQRLNNTIEELEELLAKERERRGEVEPWSTCISGAIWAEIRSGLTGRFEEQFTLHQRADRYEMSSAHLDECARILTHRIEGKLWPATHKDTQ